MDSASIFLFNIFLSDQTWTRSHAEEIKQTLGPFPASAASDACNAVKQLVGLMPKGWESKTESNSMMQLCSTVKEFGHNIAFKHVEVEAQQEECASSNGYDSLSDEEHCVPKSELMSGLPCDTEPAETQLREKKMATPSSIGLKYTGEWLKRQCQSLNEGKIMSGLEWKDLFWAVFELLHSCEENSAIENNVRFVYVYYWDIHISVSLHDPDPGLSPPCIICMSLKNTLLCSPFFLPADRTLLVISTPIFCFSAVNCALFDTQRKQ